MHFSRRRGVAVSVAAMLVFLFAFTTALNSAYRATRHNRAEGRYLDGQGLFAAGRYEDAAEEFRAALTYVHVDSRFTLALARSLMQLGRWTEAESYLGELRQDDPTNSPVNLMLARIAARDQRSADAIMYYQRALYGYWPDHADDNRIEARLELVDLLDREQRTNQALAELLQLATDVPAGDTATRLRVAGLLLADGSPPHAAELYRSILAEQPHDGAAEKGLGDSLFATGDYAGARHAYLAARKDGTSDATLEQRLGLCEAVLALDPTVLRISASERFARARELLRRVSESALRCGALRPDLAAAMQSALSEKNTRRREGDTVEMLTLIGQIWKARQDSCASQPESDAALNLVMAKMQKQ